jgi:nucleoside-diphosphate-sugar epimerase
VSREEIMRVNVEGTRRLLAACAGGGVRRVLYLSSLSVLGMMHHDGTDESAPCCYTRDPYSDSKIDSEKVVRGFAARGEVETVILRPGFVYGPGDRQFLPRLLDSLATRKFAYVGDGSKLLNVVYVDDVVQAALLADATPRATGQAYNLTDGTRTSLREFVTLVAEQAGLPQPTRQLPPRLAWALVYLLEGIAKARRSKEPPRLNRGRMKILYYNQYYSIEKARRELGYEPAVGYDEGVPAAIEWFREQGLLPAAAEAGEPVAAA